MVLRVVPVSLVNWRWVAERAIGVTGPFLIVCTRAIANVRHSLAERAAFGWAATAAVVTFFASQEFYDATFVALYGVTILMCCYAIWVLVQGLEGSKPTRYSIGVLGLVALGFAAHDVLAVMDLLGHDPLRLLPLAIPAATTIMAGVLTLRFLATFKRATNLNAELEERVEEKHAELESNFERVRDLEEIRVVSAERERIMREMHDGVGGHLVSILAMVQKGRAGPKEIAAALRLSIDDMRMVIDSLDPNLDDLNLVLGAFRSRTESRLRAEGLKLRWEVSDLPPVSRFGRHERLHVLRILQEAVTNVVRHADAKTIHVQIGVGDQGDGRSGILLVVIDDGVGVGANAPTGRGRANMIQRAQLIEATLGLDATAEGTRLELWIPLDSNLEGEPE
jgi:signal transduction histidine kinase